MMYFDAGERTFLDEMRKLSTDNAGNEVFVGLTVEESKEYYEYTRPEYRTNGNETVMDRYLALHEKHERARMAVLSAEVAARHDGSLRH